MSVAPALRILPLPAEQIERLLYAEALFFEVRLEFTTCIMQQFVYRVPVRPPVPRDLVERHALEEDGLQRLPLPIAY
jgi:hypothetical protein